MDYFSHRPRGYEGQDDSHLPKIVRRLRRALAETQSNFGCDTLRLPSKLLGDLAGILVDFAEDLHTDTGIWVSYERYNVEFFGTALPITAEQDVGSGTELRPDRFRHFLWVLYPTFIKGLTISPNHQDLRQVADVASSFLSDAFGGASKDSGVKSFLESSDKHGWDVKRKQISGSARTLSCSGQCSPAI